MEVFAFVAEMAKKVSQVRDIEEQEACCADSNAMEMTTAKKSLVVNVSNDFQLCVLRC